MTTSHEDAAMTIRRKINAAVNSKGIDADVLIEDIIEKNTWQAVERVMESMLLEKRIEYGDAFAGVYFSSAVEGRAFSVNRIVALLLVSGIDRSGVAYNQVLGICVELKDVEYMSYAPEMDPEVIKEMEATSKA